MELALMSEAYDVEERRSAAEDLAPISQGGAGQLVRITWPFVPEEGEDAIYDPATGDLIQGEPPVEYGAGIEEAYSAQAIDGSRIQIGDKKLLLSALRFNADETLMEPEKALSTPTSKAVVELADGDWAVIKVDATSPAGLPIIYTLQVRGGG